MYAGSSRKKCLLLVKQQFTKTFTARSAGTKRKKAATTKKKEATPATAAADEKTDTPGNVYPFYLPKKQPELPSNPITITPCRTDIDHERHYRVQDHIETYTFPGVTHVLSATRPRSFSFAIKNWQKNMTEEYGEEGFKQMQGLIRTQGHNFHKVGLVCKYLCIINIYIFNVNQLETFQST